MPSITVDLAISPQVYLSYYQGQVKQVLARTSDGRSVRFPANILQHVITRDGIYGRYTIEFDQQGKFVAIQRV